ncbi:transposase [Enterococcus cecorum]|uniref:transposase n=1 Tax=Enterococcus cecorum TaxID=44008 RepID=UPI00148C5B90
MLLFGDAIYYITSVAYNFICLIKYFCFEEDKHQKYRIDTIRLQILKVGAKIVKKGRKIIIKISSAHVYQKKFYWLLHKIQQISF